MNSRRIFILPIYVSLLLISWAAFAKDVTIVTSGENSGFGSLRDAFVNGASQIEFDDSVIEVKVDSTLVYQSNEPLFLQGRGQVFNARALAGNQDVVRILSGADIEISNISVFGNSLGVNPDSANSVGGKGLYIEIPRDKKGAVSISLNSVSIANVGNHGVHVSDCSLGDACGNGNDVSSSGSAASIAITLNNVSINQVGFGKQDADGLRVDERGKGDISAIITNSRFTNIGADGVELDEAGEGSVIAKVSDSLFLYNGAYCKLVPFVSSSPCDDEGAPDYDDGLDIEEADSGNLAFTLTNSNVSNNYDHGLDLDEQGVGSMSINIDRLMAYKNVREGIKVSEEDNGDINASLENSIINENNASKEGVEFEERLQKVKLAGVKRKKSR